MTESEQVVQVISTAIINTVKKMLDSATQSTLTQVSNMKFSGDNLLPLSIDSTKIKNASIDTAKIKSFSAQVADIVVANIDTAVIDTAQIRDLSAYVAQITVATIQTADIQWADIANLTAGIAEIAVAQIGQARIGYAQIDGLSAGTALITEVLGGKVAITDLAVTDANIVELNANKITAGTLSVERLVLVGSTKSIVYGINDANGTAQLSQTTIDGGSITQKTITADQIVANGITAECLNVSEIFANEALIGAIKTKNLDADEIAANAAFISKITSSMITSPEFSGLDLASKEYVRSLVTQQGAGVAISDTAPASPAADDLWIDTSLTPNILKRYDGTAWVVVNDTTALGERVSSSESSITQLNNEIATKVSTDTYNILEQRVTQAETSIVQNNASITLEVNNKYTALETLIGYRVEIVSTSDILSADIRTTTLSARIWHGSDNVTDDFAASRFSWVRVSSDSTADELWNNNHSGVKSIQLGVQDIVYSATYSCNLADA